MQANDEFLKETIKDKYYRKYDPLNLELCNYKDEFKVCGWPLTHFWFHFCIGLVCPKLWFVSLTMGIIWEASEFFISANCDTFEHRDIFNNTITYNKNYTGNKHDPLFNLSGCLLGILSHNFINKIQFNDFI
jgi:hypothetical protein